MSIKSTTPTYLIEQNTFFREGLKSLLADSDYSVEKTCSDCLALHENQSQNDQEDVKLFILGVESEADAIKDDIESIKQAFPQSKIVVLTSRAAPSCVVSAFSSGADGYLLRDVSPQALIGSLDTIMAGEKVCPVGVLSMFIKPAETAESEHRLNKLVSNKLSERELQVLKYLPSGETNKEIARNMDITEATVKVHIKAVLRKLELSNRTQAAVWAVNKGMVSNQGHEMAHTKTAA